METQLKSISSTFTTNYCRRLRERLETLPVSTASIFLVIDLYISDLTSLNIKLSEMGYVLQRRHCRFLEISDSILTAYKLYKYTWKIVVYIVLIGKERLGLNIWLKIPEQAKSIKNMIKSIWSKEIYYQCKANKIKSYALYPSGKEAKFVGLPYCYDHHVANLNINFVFYHQLQS